MSREPARGAGLRRSRASRAVASEDSVYRLSTNKTRCRLNDLPGDRAVPDGPVTDAYDTPSGVGLKGKKSVPRRLAFLGWRLPGVGRGSSAKGFACRTELPACDHPRRHRGGTKERTSAAGDRANEKGPGKPGPIFADAVRSSYAATRTRSL